MKRQIVDIKEFAVDVGEKPKENMSYAQVVSLFKGDMLKVWGGSVATHGLHDKIVYHFEPPKSKTLMAVVYKRKPLPKAIGKHLIMSSPYYRVYVNPLLLLEPKDIIKKIVTHEVIHLGYPYHDKHFSYMCQQFGTNPSLNSIKGGNVKVQEKKGSRYVDIGKAFDTFEDAEKWARGEIRKATKANDERRRGGVEPLPPKKLRLIG